MLWGLLNFIHRPETFNLTLALLYSGCHHLSSGRQVVYSSRMAEAPIVRDVDINNITFLLEQERS
jgi:hypothetical protein